MSKERIQSICSDWDIDVAFINVTATQLKKSIMDATKPVRELLKNNGLHDYATQEQGTHAKVTLGVFYMDYYFYNTESEKFTESKATLYRPTSGDGDPRIWFTNIKDYVEAGDVLAIIPNEYRTGLYAFNVASTKGFDEYISDMSANMASKAGL